MVNLTPAVEMVDNPWNDARALLADCRQLVLQSSQVAQLCAERERQDSNFDVLGVKQLLLILLKDSTSYKNNIAAIERTLPMPGTPFNENDPNELNEVLRICSTLTQYVEQWAIVVEPTIQNILVKIQEGAK